MFFLGLENILNSCLNLKLVGENAVTQVASDFGEVL